MSTHNGRQADPVRQLYKKVNSTKVKCINYDMLEDSNKIERRNSKQIPTQLFLILPGL